MKDILSSIKDQLLVMDARVGDSKAMEKLSGRWQKRLWLYTCRMTNNKEAAWDITRETWLGIIRDLGKLQHPANFKPWAYKIATNKSIDWINKYRTNKHVGI
ncbi:MAG TPA: hypothetical protein HPP87_05725 [Planctomycetes bacterium]|nr:hypothetical protein [Planctomycetota bacterium]